MDFQLDICNIKLLGIARDNAEKFESFWYWRQRIIQSSFIRRRCFWVVVAA